VQSPVEKLNLIWIQLLNAEERAHSSKWIRLLRSPFWYPVSMVFSHVLYPLMKKEWRKEVTTFFGIPMTVALPSGTDILLNGIKSHDSEIRLSKFLTRQLQPGQIFIDIGAHHGYYTLLASSLVGQNGKVYSVEASRHSFELLQYNTIQYNTIQYNSSTYHNIKIYHNAASDQLGEIVFYEYPGPYAEYNTMVKGSYDHAIWRSKVEETVTRVDTIILDNLIEENGISKATIKIDVEGGEYVVLKGLGRSLSHGNFTIIMEYLYSTDTGNFHHRAVTLLKETGYSAHYINAVGELECVENIDDYLRKEKLDSDNLVFRLPSSP